MANQRTTNKTTPPKKTTPTKKTMIGTSASDRAAQARAKAVELERRAKAMGWKTVSEYKNSGWAQNKAAFTKKPAPVKSTEVKVTTPKLTAEQMDKINFKNDAINKYSDKVYPIWQGLERNEIYDSKGNTRQPVRTAINKKEAQKPWLYQSTMYGTKEQRDSSRAVVTGTNLVKTPAGVLFKIPTKKDPLVKPGNTGKGALVRRTSAENNAQLRTNKKLTGKTGDR